MQSSKESLIDLLESAGTFLTVFLNWTGFRNANINQETANVGQLLGFVNFSTLFVFLLCTVKTYTPHLNPVVTGALYLMGQTKAPMAHRLLLAQLKGLVGALLVVFLCGLTTFSAAKGQGEGYVKVMSLLDEKTEENDEVFFFRRVFLGFFSAFVFGVFYSLGYKRCADAKLRFALMVSSIVFAISSAFSNKTIGCLNPMYYLPFSLVSWHFHWNYLIFFLLLPVAGILCGSYVGMVLFKDYAVEEKNQTEVAVDLDLIKQRDLQFEY